MALVSSDSADSTYLTAMIDGPKKNENLLKNREESGQYGDGEESNDSGSSSSSNNNNNNNNSKNKEDDGNHINEVTSNATTGNQTYDKEKTPDPVRKPLFSDGSQRLNNLPTVRPTFDTAPSAPFATATKNNACNNQSNFVSTFNARGLSNISSCPDSIISSHSYLDNNIVVYVNNLGATETASGDCRQNRTNGIRNDEAANKHLKKKNLKCKPFSPTQTTSSFAEEMKRMFDASRKVNSKKPWFNFDDDKRLQLRRQLASIFCIVLIGNVLAGSALASMSYYTIQFKLKEEYAKASVSIRNLGIRMKCDSNDSETLSWMRYNETDVIDVGDATKDVDAVNFNSSSGHFIAELEGFYQIFCRIYVESTTSGVKFHLKIQRSSVVEVFLYLEMRSPCTKDKEVCQSVTIVKTVHLEKGDSVAISKRKDGTLISRQVDSYFVMHLT